MSRGTVAVRIAGHEYKIRTESDAALIRELAGYVDRAMKQVRDRTGTVDTLDVAVLTCLNLAREILSLRSERLPDGMSVVDDERLRAMIERVEALAGCEPVTGPEQAVEGEASATRTIELPTVEPIREDAVESGASDDVGRREALDAPRAAAGGRDRAS